MSAQTSERGAGAREALGRFDTRVKYGRDLEPDADPAEVLWHEKLREDVLREVGWLVVRWTWADLRRSKEWLTRLARPLWNAAATSLPPLAPGPFGRSS